VRSHKGSHLQGGADRTSDPVVTNSVFLDIQVSLPYAQFKAGGSWGSCSLLSWPASEEDPAHCSACDPDPGSDLCIPESSSCLLLRPAQDILVLPASCWKDASTLAPNSKKLSIGFAYFALFLLLLILLALLLLLVKLYIINL